MSDTINVYFFLGLKVKVTREEIERQIHAMEPQRFKLWAGNFLGNKYYPCCCRQFDPQKGWTKEQEEYENKGLIRREGGVMIYWENDRFMCLWDRSIAGRPTDPPYNL